MKRPVGVDFYFTLLSVITPKLSLILYPIVPDVKQNGTTFSGVVSLGKANINAPRSENEILQNMAILNKAQGQEVIKVSLSVPNSSDGFVQ